MTRRRMVLRPVLLLLLFLLGAAVCMAFADGVRCSGGAVRIVNGRLHNQADGSSLTYECYCPLSATAEQPGPGVLLLPGNGENGLFYAAELARRGAVVLIPEEYTTGEHGGAAAAYWLLSQQPNVDGGRLALCGEPEGCRSVAARYADTDIAPKAVVLPWGSTTGEETEALSNMLLMQPEYGEKTGTDTDELQWDMTFGSFADGSAQRVELISTVPALAAHSAKGLAAALRWLKAAIGLNLTAPASDQIAMVAEWLTLAATLLVLCALVPLSELLLRLPGLCTVVQPLPSGDHLAGWGKRWGSALFFVLAAGASYPVMTWLGQKLPGQVFRIPAGNGFFAWYGLLAVVLLLANRITCRRARRRGRIINCYDMGLSSARWPEHIDLGLYLWSLLLAALGVGMIYGMNALFRWQFRLELQFVRPLFCRFTRAHAEQIGIYYPVITLCYLVCSSRFLALNRTNQAYLRGIRGFSGCWWRCFLVMAGSVLLALAGYAAAQLSGFGADAFLGAVFGNSSGALLLELLPQTLLFSLLGTACYRRTGTVVPGSFLIAALSCWWILGKL